MSSPCLATLQTFLKGIRYRVLMLLFSLARYTTAFLKLYGPKRVVHNSFDDLHWIANSCFLYNYYLSLPARELNCSFSTVNSTTFEQNSRRWGSLGIHGKCIQDLW